MTEFTETLVRFLATPRVHVPSEMIDRTKALLLDYLGACLAGVNSGPSRTLADILQQVEAFPDRWPLIVTVRTDAGETITSRVEYPKGDPENFLSWDEVCEKFLQLSRTHLTRKRQGLIIEEVGSLEGIKNVGAILNLLRPLRL